MTDADLLNNVWNALREVSAEQFVMKGREYGGGLHKLEPKELLDVVVPNLASLL